MAIRRDSPPPPKRPSDASPGRGPARTSAHERAALIRRRRLTAVGLLAAMIAAAVLLLSGGSHAVRSSAAAKRAGISHAGTGAASTSHTPSARGAAASSSGPSPGSLPQTEAMPSTHTAGFATRMAALWSGVVGNSVNSALPAFFPRDAYVQLKAEASPEADWRDRLVHDYALDLTAAHELLGSGAAEAQLVSVNATAGYAHWVTPGVCANSVGYYEMPNARVVYRQGGRIHSFGIASMISWRGEWYVVHLGAVLREGESGTVDEPSEGPGTAAFSGTC
jgi:hypothetical protein